MGIGDRGAKTGRRRLSLPVSDFRLRKSPRNVGLSAALGEISKIRDCVADDAVSCEPVSAMKFPANREINREFFRNRFLSAGDSPLRARFINGFRENSLTMGTGKILKLTGKIQRLSARLQGIGMNALALAPTVPTPMSKSQRISWPSISWGRVGPPPETTAIRTQRI
jgi:hypothetical protein